MNNFKISKCYKEKNQETHVLTHIKDEGLECECGERKMSNEEFNDLKTQKLNP